MNNERCAICQAEQIEEDTLIYICSDCQEVGYRLTTWNEEDFSDRRSSLRV